jgi:hypothetical protein
LRRDCRDKWGKWWRRWFIPRRRRPREDAGAGE